MNQSKIERVLARLELISATKGKTKPEKELLIIHPVGFSFVSGVEIKK